MPLTVEHGLNCVYILKGKVNSTLIRLSFQFAYRFILLLVAYFVLHVIYLHEMLTVKHLLFAFLALWPFLAWQK